ncbi:exosortase family protein XrtF [Pseudotenacibaculum sp. MALMAid0570]|uniref:exosortase family protein XrtF n=1 Tax=Pseudotenacibaculum sp. MALMAid0570 TaxID=3143938 RepID=UPI0032DE3127
MKKQRSIVLFLVKFFATYFILFALYSLYLQNTQQKEDVFVCSPITTSVAEQTEAVLSFLGYDAAHMQHEDEMSVKLLLNGHYTARVIEGCNSLSIIILFISFIIAFPGSIKSTLLFGLFGSLFIYGINILRIAFLTVMLYKYPDQQEFLHNLLFPAIIYGATFLLWVVWVHKFSNYKK